MHTHTHAHTPTHTHTHTPTHIGNASSLLLQLQSVHIMSQCKNMLALLLLLLLPLPLLPLPCSSSRVRDTPAVHNTRICPLTAWGYGLHLWPESTPLPMALHHSCGHLRPESMPLPLEFFLLVSCCQQLQRWAHHCCGWRAKIYTFAPCSAFLV